MTGAVAEAPAEAVCGLTFAFQPIVHIGTGELYGVQALLRAEGRDDAGFAQALLDRADAEGRLDELHLDLWERLEWAFAGSPLARTPRVFVTLDSRVVAGDGPFLRRLLDPSATSPDARARVCVRISGLDPRSADAGVREGVRRLRAAGYSTAIADFGVGLSGLLTLLEQPADVLKIHPVFVSGIAGDMRKRLILGHTVGVAHAIGMTVIAVGIETEDDLRVCRRLGCDHAQGFLIGRPAPAADLRGLYHVPAEPAPSGGPGQGRLPDIAERIPPLAARAPMAEVLDRFRADRALTRIPVVDPDGRPVGIIKDMDLKQYVFSPFGREILTNRSIGRTAGDAAVPCAQVDVAASIEQVSSVFTASGGDDGVLLVEHGRYVGFLPASAILRTVQERILDEARDQNPLTRLPGNRAVSEYMAAAAADPGQDHVLAYLDFDDFKPFNDAYGFARGDRAIRLFADLLRELQSDLDVFVGHIGGDDFFVGIRGMPEDRAVARLTALVERFRASVVGLYDEQARRTGVLSGKSRAGAPTDFPLMSASGVAAVLARGTTGATPEAISDAIARAKPASKAGRRIVATRVGG